MLGPVPVSKMHRMRWPSWMKRKARRSQSNCETGGKDGRTLRQRGLSARSGLGPVNESYLSSRRTRESTRLYGAPASFSEGLGS
jgi:hypothetical protein